MYKTPASGPSTLMLTTVSSILASSAVLLSSVSDVSAAVLEEIVVYARKVEESSQDVPISITAFTGSDLEKRGVTDFRDITLNNPSVKINAGGAGTAISSTVAIRGNVQNDVSVVADPAVGTYVDGLIVTRTFGMNASLVDIESVQTLKGPQGTLFGRNTTGGALVIQTKNPELEELGGYIRVEGGSYDLKHVTAAVNLPLGERAALRVVVDDSDRDGFADYTDGSTFGDESKSTYRAKLLIEPNELTSILLSAEKNDVDATEAINTATQPNRPLYDNIPSEIIPGVLPLHLGTQENSAQAKTYSLTVARELESGEIKFIAGKRDLDVAINTSLPPFLGHSLQDKPDNTQKTVELVYAGSAMGDKLGITSGLYYYDETTHEDQINFLDAFNPTLQISDTPVTTESKSKSLFTQFNYQLTDSTRVLIGGRYTKDDRDGSGSIGGLGLGGYTITNLTYSSSDSEFNYLVSLDHKVNDDVLLYASTATGYRSGFGALSPAADGQHWLPLDAETVTNYEVGAKTEWLDNSLRLNAALYKQDYKDYQAAFILGAVRGYKNYDATIKGGELEMTWNPIDMLSFGGSYAYTSAETEDGLTLPNIPESTYSFYVSQQLDLEVGVLELRVDYNWSDSWFSQIFSPSLSTVNALSLLNLSATLTSANESWKVMIYGKNITDEKYYTYINEFDVGGSVFYDAGSLGLPRTVGASVTYSF